MHIIRLAAYFGLRAIPKVKYPFTWQRDRTRHVLHLHSFQLHSLHHLNMESQEFSLPDGYKLQVGYPSTSRYRYLRSVSGLSPKTPSQAAAVPTGSWFGCYITFEDVPGDPQPIGMGRVIGDGGWYFHIADMAVHPDHQRKGLGDAILKALLRQIHREAPADGKPYITLFADEAGRRLYYNNGFEDAAPGQLGMAIV